MDGVTDYPFRFIQKKYGQPAVIFTEFTSVEGVCHGASRLMTDFLYDDTQRPVVAQIYGTTPQFFRETSTLLCEMGFDGIDINMGCPAKNVAHSGAGAALIKTPKLAQEIIAATQAGISDWVNGKSAADCEHIRPEIAAMVRAKHQQLPAEYQERRSVPVSVKTRVGYHEPEVEAWISNLLEMTPATITVHGRTLKQQYGGQANWDLIAQAAELAHSTETLLLGNGDVQDLTDAKAKVTTYGLDGVLIGRSTMGNPYVFKETPGPKTIFEIAVEHAQLFEQTYQSEEKYNFLPMRKHLGWYVRSIPNASQVRIALFQTNTAEEVRSVLSNFGLLTS